MAQGPGRSALMASHEGSNNCAPAGWQQSPRHVQHLDVTDPRTGQQSSQVGEKGYPRVVRCGAPDPEETMTKAFSAVHHADRRTDVVMPYAPGIVVRRGHLVFLSGVTAAPAYHGHPHREEEFDLPTTMREQTTLAMENLKKTLAPPASPPTPLVSPPPHLT